MHRDRPDPTDSRQLEDCLSELGRAERQAASTGLVHRIEAGLVRPPLAARLPLGLAAAWRQAAALMQPAVAGSAAAAAAGLALGTWMALATPRGGADALATEPFEGSTLVDNDATGIGGDYLSAGDVMLQSEAADTSLDAGAAPQEASTTRDAGAAPGDSQGVRR